MKQKRSLEYGPVTHKVFNRYYLFGKKLYLKVKEDGEEPFEVDTGLMVPGFKRKTKKGKEILVYKWKYRDRNKYLSNGQLRKVA